MITNTKQSDFTITSYTLINTYKSALGQGSGSFEKSICVSILIRVHFLKN